ncbi:DsbA family protein [Listeria costaricensis]|uniref:DsbA family protein n=1 Tax=Listeria costaricensis TaxID=2026604 RepID=UPI000C076B28|nr:DsbA family protein [Listeria costaricensis]
MDISQIKAEKVTPEIGIHLSKSEAAKVKVLSFVNLRCPFCRKWHQDSRDVLAKFIDEGKIELVIKPFDKEKESLQPGNVAHKYLNYETPFETLVAIDRIYETQDEWGNLPLEEVAAFMEEKLGLTRQNNEQAEQAIIQEAGEANVVFVPTVIVGEHIFDEHITPEELRALLNQAYAK